MIILLSDLEQFLKECRDDGATNDSTIELHDFACNLGVWNSSDLCGLMQIQAMGVDA